jgi:Fur family ferric uptake transcriptional regulator
LREGSLRVTRPRKAMLRVLASAPTPLSVESLHLAIGGGGADLATVYRSIEAFEKAGIVQRHPLENGKSLYDLARHGHHHHVICRQCGRTDDIEGCAARPFESTARKLGYQAISHVFEIYGVCNVCAGSQTTEKNFASCAHNAWTPGKKSPSSPRIKPSIPHSKTT